LDSRGEDEKFYTEKEGRTSKRKNMRIIRKRRKREIRRSRRKKERRKSEETSVTPVENATRILNICYISFHTINFPCFFPYSFPVLHVIE
jgi:hypothetical protein